MFLKLRVLLLPFALLYGAVVWGRNLFFNWGLFKSTKFEIPVISIGNITVGGTGKTPHIEYLVRLLMPQYALAVVSRGYKRQTKGVIKANNQSTTLEIGDEPLQLFQKFEALNVVVAEKRVEGINACLQSGNPPQIVLLDDAHQHRYVKPSLSIVLIDFNRPVWNDLFLPAGNLREGLNGLKRADVIIVTKCSDNLDQHQSKTIQTKINLTASQSIFFTAFRYGTPYGLISKQVISSFEDEISEVIISFTAIANAKPFHSYLASKCKQLEIIVLPDHHHFTEVDIVRLQTLFDSICCESKCIAVTEKDAVKLLEIQSVINSIAQFIKVIPIEPYFLFSQQDSFNNQIIRHVQKG